MTVKGEKAPPTTAASSGGVRKTSMGPSASQIEGLTCLINEKDLCMYGKLGDGSFGLVRKSDWTTPSGCKVMICCVCEALLCDWLHL